MTNYVDIATLLQKGIAKGKLQTIFQAECQNITNQQYASNLQAMFDYALTANPSLFVKLPVAKCDTNNKQAKGYLKQWVNRYLQARDNLAINRPLKVNGDLDPAVIQRISAITNIDTKELSKYLLSHFLYKSIEDINGEILENYLTTILEPLGWYWCAGTIYRAVDFCYLAKDKVILLQIKNKYNTENSSSAAIRNGTKIVKWCRLTKSSQNAGLKTPVANWQALQEIVQNEKANATLQESQYLSYIDQYATKQYTQLTGM